jgi:hypothetical protein
VLEQDDSGSAELYQWIIERSPANAVFVLDLEAEPRQLCNVSDLPTFTRRAVYVDRRFCMTSPYADFGTRILLSKKIARGTPLSVTEAERIAELGRPVFLVSFRADDVKLLLRLTHNYGDPLFKNRKTALFPLRTP